MGEAFPPLTSILAFVEFALEQTRHFLTEPLEKAVQRWGLRPNWEPSLEKNSILYSCLCLIIGFFENRSSSTTLKTYPTLLFNF